jgi:hypothetical protein
VSKLTSNNEIPQLPQLSDVELHRIVEMDEAERLSSLSADTWERRYPHLIVRLSKRRKGVRLGHALMIGK